VSNIDVCMKDERLGHSFVFTVPESPNGIAEGRLPEPEDGVSEATSLSHGSIDDRFVLGSGWLASA
jgi:hypothetical protein